MDRPRKRPRLDESQASEHRDIIEPSSATELPSTTEPHSASESASRSSSPKRKSAKSIEPILIKSPFQLTRVKDLPDELNKDAVTLPDILGDPLITECWNFNFMHDVDFIMSAFDDDTRSLVDVHLVHGYWKREDPSRLVLEAQASRYENVNLHTAYMPEMFGTHHSKMIVLFRNDDTAQVIVHTANTIKKDWTTMTNGVWKSPHLPLLRKDQCDANAAGDAGKGENSHSTQREAARKAPEQPRGSTLSIGDSFKRTLLDYLRAYDAKKAICRPLRDKLATYDFSEVKALLVASVPGRHGDATSHLSGWRAIRQALKEVPTQKGDSMIVAQMSSIATLGGDPKWLYDTLFASLSTTKTDKVPKPSFKVVFPTADEIRRSVDGYMAGGSIHTKIQSKQQQKQLEYLRPILCHWANDCPSGKSLDGLEIKNSGRNRAAPHIKTYIRYGEESIDWALLTSANLSKQAWGEAVNKSGEVRVASYELGVLVWPELLAEGAVMVETFKDDMPARADSAEDARPRVGLRVPYSLPLQGYKMNEIPWVATLNHSQPDCLGSTWMVHEE